MRHWLARSIAVVGVVAVARLLVVAAGQPPPASNQPAIRALAQARPDVRWDDSDFLAADFDCDGRPDLALLGRASGRVFVGMVHGEAGKLRADTLDFAVDPSQQAAICAEPAKLAVDALDDEVAREVLGRRAPKTCKAIRLIGGECDPVHIFWNPKANHLAWWRN
jgi:hypothetical protein